MRKLLAAISISLPVVLIISLVGIPSLGNPKLSRLACRVTKWNLPVSFPQKNPVASTPEQKIKSQPVLIPRLPVTCCEDDTSCFDEVIYRDEADKIPDKKALLTAIDRSLRYLQTTNADAAYQGYPVGGITRDRVSKSLQRFRQLLLTTNSSEQLHRAIEKEFVLYQSIGQDAKGSVLFTAYYEPLYQASRSPTAEYRYPVYRLPPDLDSWPRPHPTRLELEGADGLQGAKGKLRGLELFWFRDRLEPYITQSQLPTLYRRSV